jgi:PAS domain S-box-containing protein
MAASDPLSDLILEQAAEAVVYANQKGVIERWNAAAVAMFGFSAAEAIGQNLDLMIPEHLRKGLRRGHGERQDTPGRTPDAHPRAPQVGAEAVCRDELRAGRG